VDVYYDVRTRIAVFVEDHVRFVSESPQVGLQRETIFGVVAAVVAAVSVYVGVRFHV
jgi:preprotein translocase subunit SecF